MVCKRSAVFWVWVTAFIFLVAPAAIAQTQFLFRNYSVEHALSSSTVRCIAQDHKGGMWFGTKRGLNYFDGTRVKVYQYNKDLPGSIGSDFIRALAVANDSNLWVGTDKGIFILNLYTEKFAPFTALKTSLIYDLLRDKSGKIWIATPTGVSCFDPKTQKTRPYVIDPDARFRVNPATKLEEDSDGNIWVATEKGGVIILDKKSGKRRSYDTDNSNLPSNDILYVYKDLSGDMWVGTMNAGLARFDKKRNDFKVYKKGGPEGLNNNIVRSIYQPSGDRLFVGTEGGLNILDTQTDKFTAHTHQHNNESSISDNAIYAIFGDREGGIWIGTYFGGVNYLRQPNAGIERYLPTGASDQVSGRAVSCFLEDPAGNMWIGTEDAGLNYFDTKTKRFKHYPFSGKQQSLSYYNLHVLTKDSRGQIWIGTFSGGLSVYNPVTGQVKIYKNKPGDMSSLSSNTVYSIYEDKEKRIWVGTLDGINVYEPQTDSFVRVDKMDRSAIYGIHEDAEFMWFATNNYGLLSQNKATGEWQRFAAANSPGALSSDKLLGMQADRKGNLWLATEGGGLNRFSLKTGTAEVINAEKGLPAKVIYSLVLDRKDRLWIATEKGLYSLNTHTGRIRNHSFWDGNKSLAFNFKAGYMASDGRIYLGGINGFGVFHPDNVLNIRNTPRVTLTNFQIFNKDVTPAEEGSPLKKAIAYVDKVVLHHDQTVINIEYAALSYVSPDKINYAYKLEGFDEGWINVGNQHKASYTNLSPGKYVFKVRTAAEYEEGNSPETTLEIVVLPPFYRTTLAYVIYALMAVGIFLWLRNYYKRKHERENEIQLERLRIKNEKEFYNQKIDFFTMMAHEVRTPLSLIGGPLEKLLELDEFSPTARQHLETIETNTDRLITLVNQLLDFRRIESDFYELHPEEVEVVGQIKSIYDSFASVAVHHRGLDFRWNASVRQLTLCTDVEALTKILNNLIINALKFARSKVCVDVFLEQVQSRTFLAIRVEDDGIGIPAAELGNIFRKFFKISSGEHQYNNLGGTGIGLALAKSLTEKMDGEMHVSSVEGSNTVFTVLLPCPMIQEEEPLDTTDSELSDDAGTGEYILVVEDDAGLNRFISDSLHGEGFKIIRAGNGKEALQLMDTHDINLVISDVMMPDMNGIELCKTIKDDISRSHIPVILLTAKTDSNTELAGIESGADIYITKPFKVRHLIVRVKNLLESRKKLMQKYSSYPLPIENQVDENSMDRQFIEKVVKFIEDHISDPDLSVESLGGEMAMSRSVLQRKMKALTGNTPNEFIRSVRLQYAARLLLSNKYKASEIGYMCGFSSHSYFSKCFYNQFNMTPSEFFEKNGVN